jgi:hypothetical protein
MGGQRAFALSMAIALLLVSMVTIWLGVQNSRLRQDLANTRGQETDQEKRVRDAQQQLADERTRAQQLSAELDQARSERNTQSPASNSQNPSTIALLVLTVSGVRGAESGAAPKLIVHKDTLKVQIQLKLRENEYQSYQVALQPVGGNEIYSRSHIKPSIAKSSASFNLTLPASKVPTGDYMLTLKGQTASGIIEDVSQHLFRVERE